MGSDELSGGGPVQKNQQPRNERADALTNRAQSLLLSSLHRTNLSWLAYQLRHNLQIGINYTLAQNELPSRGYGSGRARAASEFRTEDYDYDRINVNDIGILEYHHLVTDLLTQGMARARQLPYAQLPFETREIVNEQASPVVLPTDVEIQTMVEAACQYGYRDPQIDDRPNRLTTYERVERNRSRAISHIRDVCINGNIRSFQELLDFYTNRLVGMTIAVRSGDGTAILHQLASVAGVLRLLDVGAVSDEIIQQWQMDNAKVLDGQEKLRQQVNAVINPPPPPHQPKTPNAPPLEKPQPTAVPIAPPTTTPAITNVIRTSLPQIGNPPSVEKSIIERPANTFIYDPSKSMLEQVIPQIKRTGQVEFMGNQQVVSAILGDFLGANGTIRADIDPNIIRINGQRIKITRNSVTVTINIHGQLENQGADGLRFQNLQIDVTDAPKLLTGMVKGEAAKEQAKYTDTKFSLIDTLLKSYNDRLVKLKSDIEITGLSLHIKNGQLHVVIRGKRKQ